MNRRERSDPRCQDLAQPLVGLSAIRAGSFANRRSIVEAVDEVIRV